MTKPKSMVLLLFVTVLFVGVCELVRDLQHIN